jgi:hypothetical protein
MVPSQLLFFFLHKMQKFQNFGKNQRAMHSLSIHPPSSCHALCVVHMYKATMASKRLFSFRSFSLFFLTSSLTPTFSSSFSLPPSTFTLTGFHGFFLFNSQQTALSFLEIFPPPFILFPGHIDNDARVQVAQNLFIFHATACHVVACVCSRSRRTQIFEHDLCFLPPTAVCHPSQGLKIMSLCL